MAWDDDKSTAVDPDNPDPDEQLSANEWDAHVTEGHWPANELNLSVNGSGNPVITDPQNADQEVLVYNRSAGVWELPSSDLHVSGDISGDSVNTDYLYAKSFSGADADARLSNAISAQSEGQTIYLENTSPDYTTNQTFSNSGVIKGPSIREGAAIDTATWTLSGVGTQLSHIQVRSGATVDITGARCSLTDVYLFGDVTISADDVLVSNALGTGSITFEAGTTGGLVDSSVSVSVTDNGTNTVGNIG